MNDIFKKHLVFIIVTLVCFIGDRVTKHLAVAYLKGRSSVNIIENFLDLSYVENTGAAFGLFTGLDSALRVPLLTVIAIFALLFIIYIYVKVAQEDWLTRMSLSLVMGGALGNIWDRVKHGYVVDFIDVHYYRHFTWPTFNFADIVITIGAGLIILSLITGGTKKNEECEIK